MTLDFYLPSLIKYLFLYIDGKNESVNSVVSTTKYIIISIYWNMSVKGKTQCPGTCPCTYHYSVSYPMGANIMSEMGADGGRLDGLLWRPG